MTDDGPKYGGSVNRPGSGYEIRKLPRLVCELCRLEAPAPIIVDGKCSNATACGKRVRIQRRKEHAKA